jgi:hypothetical protein
VQAPVEQPDRVSAERFTSRARQQNLVSTRGAHYARGGVHVQSANFFSARLTRSRVNPGANSQPEPAQPMLDGPRAANGGGNRIEQREEPVTRRVDFSTPAASQRTSDGGAVARQHGVPALVPKSHHVLRRPDDVHE